MVAAAIDLKAALAEDIGAMDHDPLGFTLYVFPWGKAGTELERYPGPRKWQARILDRLGKKLRAGAKAEGAIREAILEAIASGHGIGKSALIAMIIWWAMSTRENTRGVVTANTDTQLRTKTWPELAKWHRLAINSDWFRYTATALHATDEKHEKTWRIDAVPWSEYNTEAFAGLHNQGNRIIVIYDEASAISDKIWEVTEGALTDEDTEILWFAFGNPTRNTGRFRECFGSLSHRWEHQQIDSREVEGTNKNQIKKWVQDYGEDSDFVRVRVKGQFPRAGTMQFISSEYVEKARERKASCGLYDPIIIGVDVARYGDDRSVIYLRRGIDGQTIPPIVLRGVDTMNLAGRVASEAQKRGADMVFVDETGVGAGVVDRLVQLGCRVMGVNNSSSPDGPVEEELVANKGAECWAKMKAWLKSNGAIGKDNDLKTELESREFGYDRNNQILLEKKDDMKKRGLSSPDMADALALTFAYPVIRNQAHSYDDRGYGGGVGRVITDRDE